jgi:phosphohistidine phosphatase
MATASSTTTLYLLRHAHAAVALPGQGDHQRPLDSRGQRDASRICEAIAGEAASIDVVLCSTSARTRQTLDALRPFLGPQASVVFCDTLYESGAEAYFQKVKTCGAPGTVLVIGHNPSIEEFAIELAGDGEPSSMALLREGMPTAALATLSFPTDLAAIAPGSGFLQRLLRPRDLED